jgi:hypothetical protein
MELMKMNNENKYQFINNLSKEYQRILWSIMIKAESNKFVSECEKLTKQDCKLIMRYLYKKNKEIEHLQNLIDKATNYYLKELSKKGSIDEVAVEMFNLLEENK